MLHLSTRRFCSDNRNHLLPCVGAANPPRPLSLNGVILPVAVSIFSIEATWLGTFDVCQIFPSRSSQASCTVDPIPEGVPSDHSDPSLVVVLSGSPASGLIGTSYSRKTTRAVSPDGRGRSLSHFIDDSPGPRARAR